MEFITDRKNAVSVIRQLFDKCRRIEGKSIKLMPPDADSVLSKGYQIHITIYDDNLEQCIAKIADENGLAVNKEANVIVIYKPIVE